MLHDTHCYPYLWYTPYTLVHLKCRPLTWDTMHAPKWAGVAAPLPSLPSLHYALNGLQVWKPKTGIHLNTTNTVGLWCGEL